MLGGNAEYMAKNDLRKAGLSDELIAEATGYAETDDRGDPRRPRGRLPKRSRKYKAEIAGEAERGARGRAACSSSAPSATTPAASTTSSAAVPAVRATRARRRFYLSLEDDLLRLFGGERITNLMDTPRASTRTRPSRTRCSRTSIENAQTQASRAATSQSRKSVA